MVNDQLTHHSKARVTQHPLMHQFDGTLYGFHWFWNDRIKVRVEKKQPLDPKKS